MLLDEISTKECEAVGLKLNEMLLMMALRRVGPPYALRPTDILKMHSVTSGTATYRIDQLTKQDLAERIPDPSDRRGVSGKPAASFPRTPPLPRMPALTTVMEQAKWKALSGGVLEARHGRSCFGGTRPAESQSARSASARG